MNLEVLLPLATMVMTIGICLVQLYHHFFGDKSNDINIFDFDIGDL